MRRLSRARKDIHSTGPISFSRYLTSESLFVEDSLVKYLEIFTTLPFYGCFGNGRAVKIIDLRLLSVANH